MSSGLFCGANEASRGLLQQPQLILENSEVRMARDENQSLAAVFLPGILERLWVA
jgi:hypothetical protein